MKNWIKAIYLFLGALSSVIAIASVIAAALIYLPVWVTIGVFPALLLICAIKRDLDSQDRWGR